MITTAMLLKNQENKSVAEFLIKAYLAGIGVALVAGPLGCFVVWRRMSYFGDTLSHSALLGIALGVALNLNVTVSVVIGCLLISIFLVALQHRQIVPTDTLLGILAHSTLALGVLAIGFLEIKIDLMAYLFGDLLTVTNIELAWIFGGAAFILGVLILLWRPFIAITIDEELAAAEGYPVPIIRLTLMLLIAIVIAVAMKIVGVLLITSLLIIPAAASRRLASNPEVMACIAAVIGIVSVCLGISLSVWLDSSTGPTIVLAATILFLLVYLFPRTDRN